MSELTSVLVVGGTGRTGALLVRRLCTDPGYRVAVLARDPAKAAALQASQWPAPVRVVQGDLSDVRAWEAELRGVDVVATAVSCGVRTRDAPLAALGLAPEPPSFANLPRRIDNEGIAALCDAAAAHGVRRIVAVTTASTATPWSLAAVFLNLACMASVKHKFEGEQAIRKSGLDFAVVRPFGLIDIDDAAAADADEAEAEAVCAGAGAGAAGTGLRGIEWSQGRTEGTRKRIPRADVARLCHEAMGRPPGDRLTFECWGTEAHANGLPWGELRQEAAGGAVEGVDHDPAIAAGGALLMGVGALSLAGAARGLSALLRRLR